MRPYRPADRGRDRRPFADRRRPFARPSVPTGGSRRSPCQESRAGDPTLCVDLLHRFVQQPLTTGDQRDSDALLGQCERDALPQPPAGPGHDGDFALQTHSAPALGFFACFSFEVENFVYRAGVDDTLIVEVHERIHDLAPFIVNR